MPNRDVSRNVYVRLVCEDLVPVKRLKDEGEKLPPYVVILRCMEILLSTEFKKKKNSKRKCGVTLGGKGRGEVSRSNK